MLAAVRQAMDYEIKLNLPNNVVGVASITNMPDSYTNLLKRYAQSSDDLSAEVGNQGVHSHSAFSATYMVISLVMFHLWIFTLLSFLNKADLMGAFACSRPKFLSRWGSAVELRWILSGSNRVFSQLLFMRFRSQTTTENEKWFSESRISAALLNSFFRFRVNRVRECAYYVVLHKRLATLLSESTKPEVYLAVVTTWTNVRGSYSQWELKLELYPTGSNW